MNVQTFDPALDDLVIAKPRKEIVFIEDNVPDLRTLIDGMGADKEVVILDSTKDGLRQIADAMAGRSDVDALHIVSHGVAGSVDLGSLLLDADNLGAHGAELQAIKQGMAAGGDILLYGCDIGAGSAGQTFVEQLAIATGADVAASSNLTGSAALGGDWNLEISSGHIESRGAVDASLAALYQQTLNIASVNVDFNNHAQLVDSGGNTGAQDDVVVRVNGDANYLLKIDGATKNVAVYNGYDYLVSDSQYGSGETMLTFNFLNGQVFSPTSIDVANFQGSTAQHLVFKAYDAANNYLGTRTGDTDNNVAVYTTVSLAGLTNVARLTLTGDPATNGGKLVYLVFDNFQLTNIQPPAPSVSSVSASTANGTYKAGDTISVQVNFSGAVDVTGTPQLKLETGTTDRVVNYASGSGTSTLTFQYTVQAGDTSADLDYFSTGALALNGGTIKVQGGSADASLALPTPGGIGSLGANKNIVVDGVAPTLAITSNKTALHAGDTATITFTFSEDPGASFTWNGSSGDVTVSGGTLSAISGSGLTRTATFTPTAGVNSGTASIGVNAGAYADAAGNINTTTSNGPAITYDTLAPSAPSTPSLAAADDKGASSSDGITNKTTLLFSGTAEANAAVKLYDTDGVTVVGSGSADASGNWSFNATLAAGAHMLTAKATDAAGNASAASAGRSVVVDTTAPTLTIASDKASLKAGETATITFTFSEDPGASFGWDGSSGDVAVSGGTLSAISGSGLTRTATFTPTANTDAGSASIAVTGANYQDTAGNNGANASLAFGYDTLAPSSPSAPVLDANDDSGASNSDLVTKAASLHFSGTAEAGATVKLYDGATEVASVTATGGNYSFTVANPGEGDHTYTARAIDAAGNASTASTGLTVTVDRTGPATTVAGATLSADTGASSTDMVTRTAAQTISGTLSANLAAGEQVLVSLDNGATWTSATTAVGSNSWSLAGVTLAGSDTLKVKVVDAAGNDGVAYAHAYVLDTAAPAVSTPDLDAASDSGASNTDNITGVTLPSFSGTAEVGATVRLYDGGNEIGSAVATDGTWHITTDSAWAMNQRIHYITADATDLAGNHGSTNIALEVDVRTAAPSTSVAAIALSADSGIAGDFVTNTAAQTVSGTLSAALAANERVQVSLDGGASWTDATATTGSNAWSQPLTLSAGSHDIQVRVVNEFDNAGPVLTQAYTLDSTAPTVSISSSLATLKVGETATITFTFSEDPGTSFSWDGSAGDIAVSGGTLSAMSGSGTTRTATFTPDAGVNNGTASISIAAGSYHDLAGNNGAAGLTPSITFDTLAPAAPTAPHLDPASDSADATDNVTNHTSQLFTGSAEAGSLVTLYDSDGTTAIGSATATGGAWSITAALTDGVHTVTAKAADAAGNVSAASSPLQVTVDSAKPAAMAAPALAAGSDSGALGDGITKVAKPTFKGTAEAFAQVTLYDGAAVLGTIAADAAGNWQITPAADLLDGDHTISARQVDRAGNQSDAGTVLNLSVDTVAPAVPAAPALKASSDTGTVGDGITQNNTPVIEGTALANTLVNLYDGAGKIGSAMADGSGNWSIATSLSYGSHSLSVTQSDVAGNESAHSAAFALRVDAPPAPPTPTKLVDGVAVDIQPISLPGGIVGSAVSVPVVSTGRVESSGQAGVADIPLVTGSTGGTLLLAQLAPGYGLSASGANVPLANAGEALIVAIKAATPSHAPADQGHLTGNGQDFLDGLASGSLLVETIRPVSGGSAPAGALTLHGPATGAGQASALVIDTGGLAAGSTIALQQVNFGAVIGAANVVTSSSMILTGDAAGQHFTVTGGGSGSVFAGGGADTLSFGAGSQAQAAGTTLLHGGTANDVASFSGARADYALDVHNGYIVVSSLADPAAKAMVVNVEQLQFSDGSMAVQNSADMGVLAGIYQNVLGRQADVLGIEYWADVHQAGASWGAIALDMIGSTEKTAGHEGFNGVPSHDIAMLYTALFNRAPDAAGLAYWTDAMAHGLSLEQVASNFVQSVEMVGHQRAALDWDFTV